MKAVQGVGLMARVQCLQNYADCKKEQLEPKVECLKQVMEIPLI